MTDEVLHGVRVLFTPGQVIEVRAITDDGMASGYFDDPEQLAAKVDTLDGLPGMQGIYVTLNEVNPALLSRRANRIKTRLSKKDATTADADILRRHWFPVDVDPVRPSGVSSTDEEHQAALDSAVRIADYLGGMGWPAPVFADSGNGAHLLYRIDLPNDDRNRDLVKRCLEVLSALFDDDQTTVDTANHNAARIWKLYGTMSRKGDNTSDRPHRRSRILSVPVEVEVVAEDFLDSLAAALPSGAPDPALTRTKGPKQPINLASWLRDHNIIVRAEKPYQGGTLFILDGCPFSGAHRDGAFAIQFPSGAIYAGCHHASCGGGSQRWQELRERFEPIADRRKAGPVRPPSGPGAPSPGSRTGPSPPIALDELPGREEAVAVLQYGDPKQVMLRTFALDHEGDEVPAECMILSLASRSVLNTNGLHVSVTGESGKGKSHAFTTLLQQVPERFRLAGRMSNKALFYIENLQPGSAIVFDDTTLSEDMAEILKGVTTSFREPFLYRTVSKDRKGQVCTIPERCIWWVAKVEGAGDDQVFNRMLTCWIDDSAEQDDRVLARILLRDLAPPEDQDRERPEVLACQAIWEIVGRQMFFVAIPFATRIRFLAHANRRNPEMLLDLIKANAVLRFMQRGQTTVGTILCLTATREDFREAVRLYGLLNGTSGGQETKLTRKESDLIDIISHNNWPEFTIPQLQKETGWSNSTLHRLIHGYESRGSRYTGLLEKCPALSFCDRTVVTDEEAAGLSMRRRTNAYMFDQGLYRSWSLGGTVWLDDDDDPDHPSALQQSFSNPSASTERFENEPAGFDSPKSTYNKNIFFSTHTSFSKSKDSQHPEPAGMAAGSCVCDPKNAEVLKDTIEKKAQDAAIVNQPSHAAPNYPSRITDPDEGLQKCCRRPAPAVSPGTRPRIQAKDYKPLEVPEHTACYVCGTTWSHYVEKLTEERKGRPKHQQQARRICKTCYKTEKKRAQRAAVVLPGTVEVSHLEPLKAFIGPCSVCELEAAAYIDRTTGVKLCEFCYQHAIQPHDQGEVAG